MAIALSVRGFGHTVKDRGFRGSLHAVLVCSTSPGRLCWRRCFELNGSKSCSVRGQYSLVSLEEGHFGASAKNGERMKRQGRSRVDMFKARL